MLPLFSLAQEETVADTTKLWKVEGNVTLNFSQISLTNWVAGGESSTSGIFMTNISANYTKDKISWDNSVNLRYGFLKQNGNNLQKTDDNIDLNSKLGIKAKKNWFYSGFVNFKSQFRPGYNYSDTDNAISDLMSPGYFNLGAGMEYKTEKLSVLLAPVSGKFTFVTNDVLAADGAFGVDKEKNLRSEFGATLKLTYKTEVVKNVTLENKLDLFSNYLNNPQNIDVDWNVLINMKINDFLSANLVTHLIYDDDINIDIDNNNDGVVDESGPRIQFMEMFGVGITYKF